MEHVVPWGVLVPNRSSGRSRMSSGHACNCAVNVRWRTWRTLEPAAAN